MSLIAKLHRLASSNGGPPFHPAPTGEKLEQRGWVTGSRLLSLVNILCVSKISHVRNVSSARCSARRFTYTLQSWWISQWSHLCFTDEKRKLENRKSFHSWLQTLGSQCPLTLPLGSVNSWGFLWFHTDFRVVCFFEKCHWNFEKDCVFIDCFGQTVQFNSIFFSFWAFYFVLGYTW